MDKTDSFKETRGGAQETFELAMRYYKGEGMPQDLAKAAYWYEKAALSGDADAQFNIAMCYGYDRGVERNETKEAYWRQKAAAQGLEESK